MVNTEDFVKRLEIILDYYNLNASSFADKIGAQRSSLSHLLSGRNKPSLDFILKILDVFPEVDLYWILNGKGTFPKNNQNFVGIENQIENNAKQTTPISSDKIISPGNLISESESKAEKNKFDTIKTDVQNIQSETFSDELDKIVFFYKNGTFKIFKPN